MAIKAVYDVLGRKSLFYVTILRRPKADEGSKAIDSSVPYGLQNDREVGAFRMTEVEKREALKTCRCLVLKACKKPNLLNMKK